MVTANNDEKPTSNTLEKKSSNREGRLRLSLLGPERCGCGLIETLYRSLRDLIGAGRCRISIEGVRGGHVRDIRKTPSRILNQTAFFSVGMQWNQMRTGLPWSTTGASLLSSFKSLSIGRHLV